MSSTSEEITPPYIPQKRRRSSLMTRKSIAPVVVSHSQEVVLKQYISAANQEAEDWVALAKQRYQQGKTAEAVLTQVSSEPPTFTLQTIKNDLRKEDLEFLENQPDYVKLCSEIETFAEAIGMLKTDVESTNSLIKSNLLRAQSRLNSVAKNICTYNDKAPLWCVKSENK